METSQINYKYDAYVSGRCCYILFADVVDKLYSGIVYNGRHRRDTCTMCWEIYYVRPQSGHSLSIWCIVPIFEIY